MVHDNTRERGEWSEMAAAQIRAERAAAGWTQAEMVKQSGIPRQTYIRLEKGTRVIDITQLGRVCAALNIPLITFMQRVQDRVDAAERGEDGVGAAPNVR